jgi:hypothetical protein
MYKCKLSCLWRYGISALINRKIRGKSVVSFTLRLIYLQKILIYQKRGWNEPRPGAATVEKGQMLAFAGN